jgi:integrase
LGFDLGNEQPAVTVSQRVAVAFLFALETAMRASEICGLLPRDVAGRVAKLTETEKRDKETVPLFKRAVDLPELLPTPAENATIFGITTNSDSPSQSNGPERKWSCRTRRPVRPSCTRKPWVLL